MNKPTTILFALAMAVLLAACLAIESEEWNEENSSTAYTVPTTCVFDELNGSGYADQLIYTKDTAETVSFTVANAELTEVEGSSCQRYTPGLISPEYPGCEQYFNCGPCRWLVKLTSLTSGWTMRAYPYDIEATGWEGCESYKYAEYTLGEYSTQSGGPGPDPGPDPGPGPNTCPSSCQVGLVCCKPPFCSGDCIGSPCC
jgi:hypothetical protein